MAPVAWGHVPNDRTRAKAIDDSLKCWHALTPYIYDGALSVDKNWVENQIRPIAAGRKNSLFAGTVAIGTPSPWAASWPSID